MKDLTYTTDSGEVTLNFDIVQKYLVAGDGRCTQAELVSFIKLCQYQALNPFLREAYLIKYGDSAPATLVVGKDVFNKRASSHPDYNGCESGVVIRGAGQLIYRAGSMVLDGETLVGGWAKVYRKSWAHPVEKVVSFEEYVGKKKDGIVNRQWSGKPGTMIVKVADAQAKRDAFPERLASLYNAEEMGVGDEQPSFISPAEGQGTLKDAPKQAETPQTAPEPAVAPAGAAPAPPSSDSAGLQPEESPPTAVDVLQILSAPGVQPETDPKKTLIKGIFAKCRSSGLKMADLVFYLKKKHPEFVENDDIKWQVMTMADVEELDAASGNGAVAALVLEIF